MTRILGISGSLRERSYNTALLREADALAPPDVEVELFDLSEIPLYNDDVEAVGDPEPVAELRAAVAGGRRPALRDAGIQPRHLGRPQERDRLALAAGAGLGPPLEAGRRHGRLERPRRTRRAQQQVRDALLFGRGRARGARGGRAYGLGALRPRPRLTDENVGAAVTDLIAALVDSFRAARPRLY